MNTKISTTEIHKGPDGDEYLMCRGKLMFLHLDILPAIGMLGSNNVHPLFLWTQQHTDMFDKLPEYHKSKTIYPIIVSDTEFETDQDLPGFDVIDNVYLPFIGNTFYALEQIKQRRFKKILAKPENFSTEHLQYLVDNNVQAGDDILVRCNTVNWRNQADNGKCEITLDNNHIAFFLPTL